MTWPPRWTEPHFKTGTTSRVEKRQKRAKEKTSEEKHKAEVRRRDKRCRFPLCGCRKLKILPHVAHQQHKGIGGNPTGDRSLPELMIYVCACRHRENVIALDKGTLRWRELEKGRGANGPVAWDVHVHALPPAERGGRSEWFEVAREKTLGQWHEFTPRQLAVLRWLASMET